MAGTGQQRVQRQLWQLGACCPSAAPLPPPNACSPACPSLLACPACLLPALLIETQLNLTLPTCSTHSPRNRSRRHHACLPAPGPDRPAGPGRWRGRPSQVPPERQGCSGHGLEARGQGLPGQHTQWRAGEVAGMAHGGVALRLARPPTDPAAPPSLPSTGQPGAAVRPLHLHHWRDAGPRCRRRRHHP